MKMKGFMCQSSEVVCMANDPRSVIVPRRPDKTIFHESRSSLINNSAYYSRLMESRRFVHEAANKKRVPVCRFVPEASNNLINVKTRSLEASNNKQLVIKQDDQPTNLMHNHSSSAHVFQVVVMRVSLHCQGCADKVKKHLSKMEGVNSFSIDLETKRVTVMGHVSPDGVLQSISKVKRAEFWNC